MNLHGVVSPVIAAVNPMVPATVRVSTGYTTSADGTRVPTYIDTQGIPAQIQALQYTDIQQISGLQLNGERRKIYLAGNYDSMNRPSGTGGDLIIFPPGNTYPFGTVWLVAMALETWPDWCSLACTRQLDS